MQEILPKKLAECRTRFPWSAGINQVAHELKWMESGSLWISESHGSQCLHLKWSQQCCALSAGSHLHGWVILAKGGIHKQGIHSLLYVNESSYLPLNTEFTSHCCGRGRRSALLHQLGLGGLVFVLLGLLFSVPCAIGAGIGLTVACCPGLWRAWPLHVKVSSCVLLVREEKHVQERFIL